MIIRLEEAKYKLQGLEEDVKELGSALKIDKLRESAKALEEKTFEANFWDDQEKSGATLQELKRTKDKIEAYEKLCRRIEDSLTLAEMGIEENDESVCDEVDSEVKDLEKSIESMNIETLLSGPYDRNNAILSFHPGAGGTEAQDWASMLYRMYTRWAERHGYTVKLLDWLDGDEAGLKSATILIEGTNAYGYMKSENGVHRLVRISPFDANARRHTSFAAVDVMPELDDTVDIKIDPSDLKVDTYRASGAGGQHVNKTSSAVRMTHIPTGIIVQCQNERSQIQNRERCMQLLRAKLYEYERAKQEALKNDIAGDYQDIEWGSQIRSYVFQPYKMVKDHRTGAETGNVQAVMDGGLDMFIEAYLRSQQKKI